MLAAHLGKGLIGALNDALAADIDPRPGRHLAVHHQSLLIELVEMRPIGPFGNEVRIGDEHARRALMRAEHADGLSRLHEQRLVGVERLQGFDDLVEGGPVARGLADTAIDDEVLRPLGNLGIEIVHQHAHRRFRAPVLASALGPARASDDSCVLDIVHDSIPLK
jgi:hypothetical protein